MWLILLLLQITIKIPQADSQTATGLHQKGPNYEERFKPCENKSCSGQSNFLRQNNDFPIDSATCYGPALQWQSSPQTVFDGTNYFAIWADERRSVTDDAKNDVYGSRVSPDGDILDPNGIFISYTNSGGGNIIGMFPTVAYGAGVYLCVHEDYDWGFGTWDLWGVRVDTAGYVLDSNRIQITNRTTSEGMARVSFDGTNFLVVWCDYDGDQHDIFGARVTPGGVVLDPSGFSINNAAGISTYYCDVVFDGTNYLVVWTDERNSPGWTIYGARVTPDAVVLDHAGFAICDLPAAHGCFPKIAFGAGNYLVVWEDQREGSDKIYGARVTPQAQVLDPDGISISPAMIHTYFPSVTFDGQNYCVFWCIQAGQSGCYGARVNPQGILLDSAAAVMQNASEAYTTSSASDGMNSFCTWNETRLPESSGRDIWSGRMNQSGVVLDTDGFLVSTQVNIQELSSIACDDQNYFVVWDDHQNTWDINGKFVGQTGGPVGSLIPVSTKNKDESWPCISFGDSNYLAVWHAHENTWDIFGTRISRSGEILDQYGIAIGAWSGDQGYPSIAFDGTNWLAVWDDSRSDDGDIYGARINPQGQNLDPFHISISTENMEQWFPAIGFDGTNYIVVWQDRRGPNFDIYCARVDTAGNVLDPNGIVVSSAAVHQYNPRICFDGINYFIVWMDWRNYGTTEWDIFGARVTIDGTVLDPSGIPICTAQYDQSYPNVTYDGANYVVLWEDYRGQETFDIYGAVVNTSGMVVDSFIAGDEGVHERYPALAKGASFAHALFTYAKKTSPYDIFRVYGQYYPPVGIEESKSRNLKTGSQKLAIYPNPFSGDIHISYSVPYSTSVSLKLYGADGRFVGSLIDDLKTAGIHTLAYNGKKLPCGIYFLDLRVGQCRKTVKIIKGLN